MKENAPSTPNETPSSSDVLADFKNQRDDLTNRVDELENKPGFRMKAEELIQHRQEKKLAKEALSAFASTYAEHGGDAIDEAQKAVDSLNFRSTAEDHIKAKTALRDAKNAFYTNYSESQNANEVAEDIEASTDVEAPKITETTEPAVGEIDVPDAAETDTEDAAEDIIEDTTETQDDSDREALKAELEADAERLDAALTRSDAEAEAAAELTPDTTETDEDAIEDDEPTPEVEDTSTERETRRERREYRRSLKDRAKNIKRIRKEQKKQFDAEARAKVAQDKREQEVLNYNRDQQHGIVKKSRIGSILRRLKGVGSKTVSGLKKGVSLLNPDNGYLKRYENDTTDSTDADEPSDLDLAVNAINKRGEEAEADVVDFPSRNHSRVDSRGSDEYNEALDRVVAGINERGGDVTDTEVEKVKAKAAQEKAKSDNDDNEKEVA